MTACLNHPENCTKKVLLHAWWYHPQMLGSRHWPEPVSEEASTWPMTFPAQNWVNFNDILPWFPEYSHLYIYTRIYIYYIYICVCVWWCHPMVMMLSHQECSRSYQHLAAVLGGNFRGVRTSQVPFGCLRSIRVRMIVFGMHLSSYALSPGRQWVYFKSRISTQQIPAVSQWLGF